MDVGFLIGLGTTSSVAIVVIGVVKAFAVSKAMAAAEREEASALILHLHQTVAHELACSRIRGDGLGESPSKPKLLPFEAWSACQGCGDEGYHLFRDRLDVPAGDRASISEQLGRECLGCGHRWNVELRRKVPHG